jgi:hypothetical protein
MSAKWLVGPLSPSGQTKGSVIKRIHRLSGDVVAPEPCRASPGPEERADRLAAVLSMLAAIQEAASRSQNRDRLLNETCRLAQDAGRYLIARVILINPKTRVPGTRQDRLHGRRQRDRSWCGHSSLLPPDTRRAHCGGRLRRAVGSTRPGRACGVSLLACQRIQRQVIALTNYCFIYVLSSHTFGT